MGEDAGGDRWMRGAQHRGRAPIIAGLDEPPRFGKGPPGEVAPEIRGANPLYGATQLDAPRESRVDHAEVRRGKSAANRLFGVRASAHDPPFTRKRSARAGVLKHGALKES